MQHYTPPNLVEIAQSFHKMPLSHKTMTSRLLSSHGEDMLKLVNRLFKESEDVKVGDLSKIIATLLPYFFIKSDNAIDLKLSDEFSKVLRRPQEFTTASLERIVQVIEEERMKSTQ
jgi:hypothetical protein